jgi:hypothetical protein
MGFSFIAILFKETLEFKDAVNIQSRILIPQTWDLAQKMLEISTLVVTQCIFKALGFIKRKNIVGNLFLQIKKSFSI